MRCTGAGVANDGPAPMPPGLFGSVRGPVRKSFRPSRSAKLRPPRPGEPRSPRCGAALGVWCAPAFGEGAPLRAGALRFPPSREDVPRFPPSYPDEARWSAIAEVIISGKPNRLMSVKRESLFICLMTALIAIDSRGYVSVYFRCFRAATLPCAGPYLGATCI